MTTVNKIIVKNIRALREKHGLSQKRLADILGVKQQTVYHYESERRQVPTWVIDTLCRHFGVSPVFFLLEDTEALASELPLRLRDAVYCAMGLSPRAQDQAAEYIEFLASREKE